MLVFILALFLYQGTSYTSSQVLNAKKDYVSIYEKRGDILSEMGQTRKGEPLIVHKDYGANWWQVKLGNG
ncbi:hypothetical protein MKY34_21750 [Sporosarcina sp. FSL K6-1522]|uniref:hypothetical protein n=1 Tax=Sporosarcina sp. FSL K6-1522 TaxID=2921554 RepID=UPI003159F4D3